MKMCPECFEDKPIDDFYNSQRTKDGKNKYCKKCYRDKYFKKPLNLIPRPGRIYIISNPAWPSYFKVGQTVRNAKERLNDYQSGSPFRDYKVEFEIHVEDKYLVEKLVSKRFNGNHEWCKAELSEIITFLESL